MAQIVTKSRAQSHRPAPARVCKRRAVSPVTGERYVVLEKLEDKVARKACTRPTRPGSPDWSREVVLRSQARRRHPAKCAHYETLRADRGVSLGHFGTCRVNLEETPQPVAGKWPYLAPAWKITPAQEKPYWLPFESPIALLFACRHSSRGPYLQCQKPCHDRRTLARSVSQA